MDRTIRPATPADRKFLDHLQRKFSNQIGFLPTAAVDAYLQKSAYTLALENDEPAGFLLANRSLRWQPQLASITQAAVAMDAQRRSIGLQLLADLTDELRRQGTIGVQAVCRVDLDANAFWRAAGFVAVCHIRGVNARNKDLIVWRLPLTSKIPVWMSAPPTRAGIRATPPRLDRDPRRSTHGSTTTTWHLRAPERPAQG